jgi:hypothetical protein
VKLELFALCDYARSEPTGKLYVIGVFDHFFAPAEPAQMPPSAIASRMRFSQDEAGTHAMRVSFMDSDGVKMIPDIGLQMNVQLPPGESTVTANLVVIMPQINLPRFGEYSIDLAVDSRHEGSFPLYVRLAPQAPQFSSTIPL